ncbi:hypothetical protein QCE63_24500 [Caballeronia sp. LZ065]|uniref:hypothetical protein n=1 Tax=Caballeronia sp. LZ065 TaxID=3038571 RepID=UPI002862FE24|nr:hypothetical protein [Caballeronia sp. LZ065]MDR5782569.1 hypothetical protein [Caballeronia sp. LZ065]
MKNPPFLTHQQIYDHAFRHLLSQGRTALLPHGGGAYRNHRGGCPVGSLIRARDYVTAMEGIPVRNILKPRGAVPVYMDAGVEALKRALLRAGINIFDARTVELLSCLQNVHDIFLQWEWRDRLASIARQFGLATDHLDAATGKLM